MPANVVVPEVGESIVDARVAKWLKKEGDAVNVGDALVELETDKIDLEVAAPQAGVLGRITQRDGADVKVGDVIGVIEDAGPAASPPPASGDTAAKAEAPKADAPEPPPQSTDADRTPVNPAARNAAPRTEVDLKQVRGSGEAGRVMKREVEGGSAEATAPKAAASAPAPKVDAASPK